MNLKKNKNKKKDDSAAASWPVSCCQWRRESIIDCIYNKPFGLQMRFYINLSSSPLPCGPYCVFRSIGVLAYVMLTGISPFLGENKQETFLNISQLNVSYNEEELQQLDQAALSFIQMLLRKRPQSVHIPCLLPKDISEKGRKLGSQLKTAMFHFINIQWCQWTTWW